MVQSWGTVPLPAIQRTRTLWTHDARRRASRHSYTPLTYVTPICLPRQSAGEKTGKNTSSSQALHHCMTREPAERSTRSTWLTGMQPGSGTPAESAQRCQNPTGQAPCQVLRKKGKLLRLPYIPFCRRRRLTAPSQDCPGQADQTRPQDEK